MSSRCASRRPTDGLARAHHADEHERSAARAPPPRRPPASPDPRPGASSARSITASLSGTRGHRFHRPSCRNDRASCQSSGNVVVVFPFFAASLLTATGDAKPVSSRVCPVYMPSLFRFLSVVGHHRRAHLRRHVHARRSGSIRSRARSPSRFRPTSSRSNAEHAADGPPRATICTLPGPSSILDMLAAERGAGKNTLSPTRATLPISRPIYDEAPAHRSPMPRPTTCAAICGTWRSANFAAASVARRLSAIRQLYRFLYAEGRRADDPAAIIEGPKRGRTLPKVLSIEEVDRLLASARDGRQARAAAPERLRASAAQLPDRAALRHRAARLRTGGAAGVRRRAQRAHAGGARQGRQGAPGAAQRGGEDRDDRVSRAAADAERGQASQAKAKQAKSKWLFPSFQRERATSPASTSRAN